MPWNKPKVRRTVLSWTRFFSTQPWVCGPRPTRQWPTKKPPPFFNANESSTWMRATSRAALTFMGSPRSWPLALLFPTAKHLVPRGKWQWPPTSSCVKKARRTTFPTLPCSRPVEGCSVTILNNVRLGHARCLVTLWQLVASILSYSSDLSWLLMAKLFANFYKGILRHVYQKPGRLMRTINLAPKATASVVDALRCETFKSSRLSLLPF
mmetsp:Transcript_12705/g.24148  ORF Transcript_12705/g.24148 Transcript_12705/m.24148 type:complete len:210 (-) Transcript_12705:42-671(-)